MRTRDCYAKRGLEMNELRFTLALARKDTRKMNLG